MFDFALGLLLFLLAWSYLDAQFGIRFVEARQDSDVGIMKAKAEYAIDTLVRSGGSPDNWEELGIDSLVFPGLAQRDRELSEAKLAAFSNLSSEYGRLKDAMGLGEFDFSFRYAGGADVNAGLEPQSRATIVAVQRVALYKGVVGTATLKVYRLED